MLGINYRYEINESKGTIKLAPTKKAMLTTLAVIVIPNLFVWGLIVLDDYRDSTPKKTTNTEDHLPEDA